MSNGKYSSRKSGKAIVALVALVMILAIGIGGTLAYLTDNTEEVKNTFVVGSIGDLSVAETGAENVQGSEDKQQQFVIVPGVDLKKDPTVTYTPYAGDEYQDLNAYVFVEIKATGWEENDGAYDVNDVVSWSVNKTDWTELSVNGDTAVYYHLYEVPGEGEDEIDSVVLPVMATLSGAANGETINVETSITMNDIDDVAAAAGNIVIKAYAIQQGSFADAAAAWAAVNQEVNP